MKLTLLFLIVKRLLIILFVTHGVSSYAHGRPFVGIFEGQGRACSGKLYVKEKSIEWNTTYSICNRARYEILANSIHATVPRIVYSLDQRGEHCRFKILEIYQAVPDPYRWNVIGYASRKDYESRAHPTENSLLNTLSCVAIRVD